MERPFWHSILFPILSVCGLYLVAFIGPTFFGSPSDSDVTVSVRSVSALEGWGRDDTKSVALAAFVRSCERHALKQDTAPLSTRIKSPLLRRLYGTWADWKPVCDRATLLADGSSVDAFFEENFAAVEIKESGDRMGLFTGYYEYHLYGSTQRSEEFSTPLLSRPEDLVSADLGLFRDEWKGERLAGRLVEGSLVPYPTRSEIEADPNPEDILVWASSPVDAFFLQIQGSGRLELPDGTFMTLNYDGQNGHPYTSIGRVLIDEGALVREEVTADTIKDWLRENPGDAQRIMHANESYVFFRILEGGNPDLGPPGAQSVPLTPERSLAVDLRFHALGVPMWLETELPVIDGLTSQQSPHMKKLMVSQDTGGAIRGPIRGDVFWGFGPAAETFAGEMKHQGSLHVLVPRNLAAALH